MKNSLPVISYSVISTFLSPHPNIEILWLVGMDKTPSTLSEVREGRGGGGFTGRERRKVSLSEGVKKVPGVFFVVSKIG